MSLPPYPDPGRPDARGPVRFLWWLITSQSRRVVWCALTASLWMAGVAMEPYLIRGAIDHGLVAGDREQLVAWTGAVAAVGLATAGIGVLRHRSITHVRVDAAYRTVQAVTRKVARLGAVLPRRVATGEVVAIGSADIWHVGGMLTLSGPGAGSLVAIGVVAVLVLTISPALGLLVLLGVPAVTIVVGPLLGRLQEREAGYRQIQGELTARAGDIVAGLRVLRGIGGEQLFAGRYRSLSRELLAEGYRVGRVISWVRALSAGLPGLFVALVAWLAARMVAQGSITVGDMVAVYAYATVLTLPVAFLIGSGHQLVRGLVAARRVVAVLSLRPVPDDRQTHPAPVTGELHDAVSGLTVTPGEFLGIAADDPAQAAALADRLGRYLESTVTWGGVPLASLPLAEVRERILVGEGDAYLFAGTLRDLLTPVGGAEDAAVRRCLRAAAAEEIVTGLPDGLDSQLGGQARTLSGGQRQRLRLARALLADPEILILLEPTSAVDAHTEAAIGQRLRTVRAGRTTVVVTTSPLLLDQADRVAHLSVGQVAATGTHPELLAAHPAYRDLVARQADGPARSGAGPAEVAR